MKSYIGKIEKADLYIGQNAGKRIKNRIEAAHSSIKIISPYIADETVDLLKGKSIQGVKVEVLSSDDKRLFGDACDSSVLRKIILQNRTVDEKKKKFRERIVKLYQFIGGIITSVLVGLWFSSSKWEILSSTYFIASIMTVSLVSLILYKIGNKIRVYSYSYSTHFPISFVIDPMNLSKNEREQYCDNAFYHVKLFIIDNEVAFLGSVNLTTKGMRYNVESCVTIENYMEVTLLSNYFNELMQQVFYQKDIGFYGRQLYKEPIN